MAYVKNWLHLVWNTKLHKPFLTKEVKELLLPHIIENALGKGIYIDTINAHREHVHCLISLNADQTLSKVLQLIKGESSIWLNRQNICQGHFEWQDEYFGVSVSESKLNVVRAYIRNQEEHHRNKTYEEEYQEFIRIYNFGRPKS